MLLYGALVESNRLVLVRRTLRLPLWPAPMNGYRIALLGDFHLRDKYTLRMARRAMLLALEQKPDAIALVGDFVGYWKDESPRLLGEALEPLEEFDGPKIAVPGNHEYWGGAPDLLLPIFQEFGIRLLRNESVVVDGIEWVGLDSLNAGMANTSTLQHFNAAVALWHEPDAAACLPRGCALMLSGHSHGGQFVLPGGLVPMTSRNGRQYRRGFYPNAPTPLFVTSGIGTTGPPSRFLCPPEVVVLSLERAAV